MADDRPIFTAKIRKTFDFGKLSKSINKIIKKTLVRIGKESAVISKENLDKGMKPRLKPFSRIMRDKGMGWGGEKVGKSGVAGYKPLMQTKRLYNSIKYNKAANALEMKAYGLIQNRGFISLLRRRARGFPHKKIHGAGVSGISQEKPSIKYIKVPPRPFITNPTQKKHRKKLTQIKKKYGKDISIAFKARGGGDTFFKTGTGSLMEVD